MLLFDEVDFVQTQNLPLSELWAFLPIGYLITILIETPILLVGLSGKLSLREKFLYGVWLTACTYPIVVLVLPTIFFGQPRILYLAVAESFAPIAECLLFFFTVRKRVLFLTTDWLRCYVAIIAGNLASFGFGELMNKFGWFGII